MHGWYLLMKGGHMDSRFVESGCWHLKGARLLHGPGNYETGSRQGLASVFGEVISEAPS